MASATGQLRMDMVKRDSVVAAMVNSGLLKADDPNAAIEKLTKKLGSSYDADAKKGINLLSCDDCNGLSPETLDACPWCGIAGLIDPETEDDHKTLEDIKKEIAQPPPETKEAKPEVKAKAENNKVVSLADRKKKVTEAPTNGHSNGTNGHATSVNAQKLTKVERKKKPTGTTEIVQVSQVNTTDLDRAVHEVEKLKAEGAVSYWRLGCKIREIYEKQLYKQRIEDGKPKYRSWEAFCQHELGLHHSNALELMDVAKKFDEKAVYAFGTSKLSLMMKAPAESQSQIMEEIKKGASVRDVRERVKAAREEAGVTRRDTGRKKMPPGEKSQEKITIAKLSGRSRVKLYTKVSVGKEEPKRAKKLADFPMGRLEMNNRACMIVSITQEADGSLVAILDVQRDKV